MVNNYLFSIIFLFSFGTISHSFPSIISNMIIMWLVIIFAMFTQFILCLLSPACSI